jgi:hypothetical protein
VPFHQSAMTAIAPIPMTARTPRGLTRPCAF